MAASRLDRGDRLAQSLGCRRRRGRQPGGVDAQSVGFGDNPRGPIVEHLWARRPVGQDDAAVQPVEQVQESGVTLLGGLQASLQLKCRLQMRREHLQCCDVRLVKIVSTRRPADVEKNADDACLPEVHAMEPIHRPDELVVGCGTREVCVRNEFRAGSYADRNHVEQRRHGTHPVCREKLCEVGCFHPGAGDERAVALPSSCIMRIAWSPRTRSATASSAVGHRSGSATAA